jgi:hypothetical protein
VNLSALICPLVATTQHQELPINGPTTTQVVCELNTELRRCDLMINENFTLINEADIFRVENMIKDKSNSGYFMTYFNQIRPFKKMKLTKEATLIQNTPNAGGLFICSEKFSEIN